MVRKEVSGYICNMEIYAADGKKLEDTVLALSDRNLGQNHHIYLDNIYNSEISWNTARQKGESLWH